MIQLGARMSLLIGCEALGRAGSDVLRLLMLMMVGTRGRRMMMLMLVMILRVLMGEMEAWDSVGLICHPPD